MSEKCHLNSERTTDESSEAEQQPTDESELPGENPMLDSLGFRSAVRYDGLGRADFKDPRGFVIGPAWVEFDETGVAEGSLFVEKAAANEHLPLGLFQLFQSDRPVPGDVPGSLELSLGLESRANPCLTFAVKTAHGLFFAKEPIGYGHKLSITAGQGESTTLSFQLFNGVYAASEAAPKYWLLPLTNFVSRFRAAPHGWAQHPLRFHRVTEGDQEVAQPFAARSDKLIVFEYKGREAFIEPVPNYEERQQRLKDGRDRRLVTAMMVGELPADVRHEEQLRRYLRPDLLSLLSLATGSEVGAPWVEIRGATAELVARFHTSFDEPHFAPGHTAIDEIIHHGIGRLLSQGTKSIIYDSALLRVTSKHLVRGGLRSLTVEDRLSHLIRALDGLCKMLGISGQVTVTDLLSQRDVGNVRKIVKRAAREVRRLAELAEREGRDDTARVYKDVALRISNSTKVQTGFGADVAKLVRGHDLYDLDVVSAYFDANPRNDRRDWLSLLSYYRGLVIHDGYIDFDRNQDARDDASALLDHLHDMLLRIMLKRLDYDGDYQPTVIKMNTKSGLDWVTPETPPFHLGYE
jgi:hypothetical protein